MITLLVPDMTCGHCVQAITQAIHGVDAGAVVRADLASHRVHIDAASAGVPAIRDAVAAAGYTPLPIDGPPADARTAAPGR